MRSCQSGDSLMSRHQWEDFVKSRAATAANVIAGTPLATMESLDEWLVLHKTEGDWFDLRLLWEKKARVTESNLLYITYYYCFVIVSPKYSSLFSPILEPFTIYYLLLLLLGFIFVAGDCEIIWIQTEERERINGNPNAVLATRIPVNRTSNIHLICCKNLYSQLFNKQTSPLHVFL